MTSAAYNLNPPRKLREYHRANESHWSCGIGSSYVWAEHALRKEPLLPKTDSSVIGADGTALRNPDCASAHDD